MAVKITYVIPSMKNHPRISEAEWKVMKVVWSLGPSFSEQIIESLSDTEPPWHPKTVKAFLNRLVKKKALAFRKEGRAYLYWPLVAEKDCMDVASDSFLSTVFGGSLKPMLAHFVEQKKLSNEEIRELRRLLKDKPND